MKVDWKLMRELSRHKSGILNKEGGEHRTRKLETGRSAVELRVELKIYNFARQPFSEHSKLISFSSNVLKISRVNQQYFYYFPLIYEHIIERYYTRINVEWGCSC